MKRAFISCAAVLLASTCSFGQLDNRDGEGVRGEGTINEMSNDPQQNQRLTGTMGTSTGSTYNAGASDHSADLGGQSASTNASAGQSDKVPPPGTGMQDKGQPITSSPGAAATTGAEERVEQQKNEKSAVEPPEHKGTTSKESPTTKKKSAER